MRGLNLFESFDINAFLKGKTLLTLSQSDWKNFNTNEVIGTRFEIVVTQDNTDYGDLSISNLYEKFFVRVPAKVTIPPNAQVVLKNPIAKIWGDYRNQLSITADGIEVIGK